MVADVQVAYHNKYEMRHLTYISSYHQHFRRLQRNGADDTTYKWEFEGELKNE